MAERWTMHQPQWSEALDRHTRNSIRPLLPLVGHGPIGGDSVFARYLHAIRDTTKHAFIHCDGAVKAFAADRYPRAQHDFKHRGKGDRYRKLFRIDGEFPTAAWSEVAASWFRGNRLINEYLGGSNE